MSHFADLTATEVLLRRDRLVVAAGLVVICILSWLYLLGGAGTGMTAAIMTAGPLPTPSTDGMVSSWSATYWMLMVTMWWVMMIAMTIPSAAPAILLNLQARSVSPERAA